MLFIKNSEYNETFNNTFFIEHLKHKQTLTHTHIHTHTHTHTHTHIQKLIFHQKTHRESKTK